MRPLTFEDVDSHVLQKPGRLYLLNRGVLGARYVRQLTSRSPSSIRTKTPGKIALPAELWDMIIECLVPPVWSIPEDYILVKITTVEDNDDNRKQKNRDPEKMTRLLRCVEHKFDIDLKNHYLVRKDWNRGDVEDVNTFLGGGSNGTVKLEPSEADLLPALKEIPENVHYVLLVSSLHVPLLHDGTFFLGAVMTDIDVSDLIRYIDDGFCPECEGDRWVCPGCRQRGDRFGLEMGCGVELACPLCMGMDIAAQHGAFLQEHHETYLSYLGYQFIDHEDGTTEELMVDPVDEDDRPEGEEEMNELIEERLNELGYEWDGEMFR